MALLNLQNIPDSQMSVVSDDLLAWITSESEQRFVSELSNIFKSDISRIEEETSPMHYEDVKEDILETLRNAEQGVIASSTVYQTKSHVNRLKSFQKEKNLSTNIETAPESILSNYLSYYYFSLRKKLKMVNLTVLHHWFASGPRFKDI